MRPGQAKRPPSAIRYCDRRDAVRTACLAITQLVIATQSLVYAQSPAPPITDVAFTPDGNAIVAVSQSGLQIYRWPSLDLQRTVLDLRGTLEVDAPNLHCVAFSSDGSHVAIGGGEPSQSGSVEIFPWPLSSEAQTREAKFSRSQRLTGHDDSVRAIVWLGPTSIASASLDRTIIRWDLAGEPHRQQTLRGHSRSIHALAAFDVTSKSNPQASTSVSKTVRTGLISGGDDRSIRVWELMPEAGSSPLRRTLHQHTAAINDLATRANGNGLPMVASASADRSIRFWQPTIGRMVRYVRLPAVPLVVAWLDDKHLVTGCDDGQVRLIDTVNVQVIETLPVLEGWVYSLAVSAKQDNAPRTSIVVGGSGGQLRSLDFTIPEKLAR
ncbi:WD40 repeat domain-containing protein [Roseiconus lacunae]|uniref:WD40 repeat domain-containing protein n=1 Tax=Roseiconus lacunae TaxID=2605694 RepID=UPI001357E756|nr:hypothetical protein [Roseiconus lacunae]